MIIYLTLLRLGAGLGRVVTSRSDLGCFPREYSVYVYSYTSVASKFQGRFWTLFHHATYPGLSPDFPGSAARPLAQGLLFSELPQWVGKACNHKPGGFSTQRATLNV